MLSNSEHLGVPEDSKSPTLGVLGFTPTLGQSGVATKYVSVAIDHYSKWCEVKPMKKHTVIVVAILLEKEIICRFGVPKYVLIDNCG